MCPEVFSRHVPRSFPSPAKATCSLCGPQNTTGYNKRTYWTWSMDLLIHWPLWEMREQISHGCWWTKLYVSPIYDFRFLKLHWDFIKENVLFFLRKIPPPTDKHTQYLAIFLVLYLSFWKHFLLIFQIKSNNSLRLYNFVFYCEDNKNKWENHMYFILWLLLKVFEHILFQLAMGKLFPLRCV